MIAQWRKINIDEYITNLAEFYDDCSKGYFQKLNIVETLNQEEKIYLNEAINLEKLVGTDKNLILNKLLHDQSKFNFARHLFTSLNINLEVNSIDETQKTVFQLLFESAETRTDFLIQHLIVFLYKRGYKNTQSDERYLKDFYKNSLKSQQHLELWCLARVCYKLNNHEKIEKALVNEKVILSIFSFILKKPVGFKYPNLLGVANNAIQHYREQGELIIVAMKHYKVYDDIKKENKKGTFRLKEEEFYEFKPIQDTGFNDIAFELFPELKTDYERITN